MLYNNLCAHKRKQEERKPVNTCTQTHLCLCVPLNIPHALATYLLGKKQFLLSI